MAPFTKPTEKATGPKQRPVPHPMLQRRNNQQDQRRRVFLTKVKQNGDDRRWDSRAEQILRTDFLWRQKQWKIEQARSAPVAPVSPEDEEMEVELKADQRLEDQVVDEVAVQEDKELEALILLGEEAFRPTVEQGITINGYGSEDEEYDGLCMQLVLEVEGEENGMNGLNKTTVGLDQEMDTSIG